jgi:serine/threonine protein kinase
VTGAIAHYNLLERIGEGGLGEVYRARDTRSGRTVALKLGPALAGGAARQALLQDAQAAAALSHPNVATLFEVGDDDGRPFLAYEFVQGTPLRGSMSGTPMNTRRAFDLAIQIADALADAHAHGVVHQDLRPDNVIESGKGSAKILDFGMSAWTRGGRTRALAAASPDTLGPAAAAIVAYMSPEQALGSGADARTDVFSLAVMVYEMVTGTHPFAAGDPATTLINVTQRAAAPPTSVNPELPPLVDGVLARAMAKALEGRTDSAARFAAELRRCRTLLESRSGPPRLAPARGTYRPDVLPLEEERGGAALWWILAALGLGAGAAVWWYT